MEVCVDAIGGSEVVIPSDKVSDLGRLCGEFEFTEFAKKVEGWHSAHGENSGW
jgi:hypothetical protein